MMYRKKIKLFVFFAVATMFFFMSDRSFSADDADSRRPICEPARGIENGLAPGSIGWKPEKSGGNEEHIFLIGFTDQGLEIFTTVFSFKWGPYHKYGYYSFLYENRTKKKWFVQGECENKVRKVSHDDVAVDCGTLSFTGKWPNYRLKISDSIFQADLNYTSIVPPFDSGVCYYTPEKDVFLSNMVFMPRGKLTGTITRDNVPVKVTGQTYGDYNHQNINPTRQGPFMLGVRVFPDSETPLDDQLYFNVSNSALSEKYGGGFDKFAWLVRGDKMVGFTRNVKVNQTKEYTDPDTGYRYIRQAAIEARGKNFVARGIFTVDEVIEVMDIFEWLPDWAKKIAQSFFKRPVYFRFLGDFTGSIEIDGNKKFVKQTTTAEMNFTQ